MKNFLLLIFFCLFLFSCGNSGTAPVAEKQMPGQSLFESNCTSCHGSDGKLCVLGAKDLSVSSMNKEQMIEIITNGKSTMTSFGSVMSKEEISLVADYVATLKK
jgi:cytochrome c6